MTADVKVNDIYLNVDLIKAGISVDHLNEVRDRWNRSDDDWVQIDLGSGPILSIVDVNIHYVMMHLSSIALIRFDVYKTFRDDQGYRCTDTQSLIGSGLGYASSRPLEAKNDDPQS